MAQAIDSEWAVSELLRQNEQRRALGQAGMSDEQVAAGVSGALEAQYKDSMAMAQQTMAYTSQQQAIDKELGYRKWETTEEMKASESAGKGQLIGTIGGAALGSKGLANLAKQGYDYLTKPTAIPEGTMPGTPGYEPPIGIPTESAVSDYTVGVGGGGVLTEAGAAMGQEIGMGGAGILTEGGVGAMETFGAETAAELAPELAAEGSLGPIGWAAAGATILGSMIPGPVGEILSIPGKIVSGIFKGAVNLISAPFGGGGCICMSYIYGPGSKQVRYSRVFCLRHMDEVTLLGYYNFGLLMIALSEKLHTKFFLKRMTTPFFKYMLYKLDRGKASWYDRIVSSALLKVFRITYALTHTAQFIPQNTCLYRLRGGI
jgi:hypothetical protein